MEERDFDTDDGVPPSFGIQGARDFFLDGVSCGPLPDCDFDKPDSDLEVDVVAPCMFVDLLAFNP